MTDRVRQGGGSATHHPGATHPTDVASSISARRQQLILALLLGAFGILALASLLTYQPPAMGSAPWGPPNACGPVGAALAFGLFWVLGPAAAYGVPAIALAWGWNRLRARPAASFALSALVAVLLAFEVCVMLDLAGFGAWSGRWGFAAALVLRSALGRIGSWIVAGTVFAATSLVASELGFHWIERIVRHAIVTPATGLGGLLRAWRARRAAGARAAAKRPRV
ncbi:MAG TPA: DNA translocase FtsK 4TM domain-containing protein, partial [Candidatus Eisenbacteria bacterium]